VAEEEWEDAIVIRVKEVNGHFNLQTAVRLDLIQASNRAGVMLASATRILGLAFAEANQNKIIEEQVVADIQKVYNDNLIMGDFGETDTFRKQKEEE